MTEFVLKKEMKELKELPDFSRYLVDVENGRVFDKLVEEWKRNTINANGYIYHTLKRDDDESITMSLHQIVMDSVLEGFDYRKLNLVIHHVNNDKSDCGFENLHLTTQSNNVKQRILTKKPKRLNADEIENLHNDFKLLDELEHGFMMSAYINLANKYQISKINVQLKYLDYKKAK